MNNKSVIARGFTLIEMLLVLAIIGMIIFMTTSYFQQQALQARMDKASVQLQQILSAGMAYYVSNGYWPDPGSNESIDCLQGEGGGTCIQYLPTTFINPWTYNYHTKLNDNCDSSGTSEATCASFYAYTKINAGDKTYAVATAIAGKLPLAYATSEDPDGKNFPDSDPNDCTPSSSVCYVVTSVTIPGQNLNNADAIKFSGVYNHGGCVPVPSCPLDMVPQIMVVPVQVAGVNTKASGSDQDVYPISSFMAYAKGGPGSGISPGRCTSDTGGGDKTCQSKEGTDFDSGYKGDYWRVCMQVVTTNGDVSENNDEWGKAVSVMAITRCSIKGANVGSEFGVYTQ